MSSRIAPLDAVGGHNFWCLTVCLDVHLFFGPLFSRFCSHVWNLPSPLPAVIPPAAAAFKPLYHRSKPLLAWLSEWCRQLIGQSRGPRAQLFMACRPMAGKDVSCRPLLVFFFALVVVMMMLHCSVVFDVDIFLRKFSALFCLPECCRVVLVPHIFRLQEPRKATHKNTQISIKKLLCVQQSTRLGQGSPISTYRLEHNQGRVFGTSWGSFLSTPHPLCCGDTTIRPLICFRP